MKAFITGATGFIGGYVARKLRARGDDVVALVRNPDKARALENLGIELKAGDLSSDVETLRSAMSGCDAVFHIAAVYKVGIPKSEHAAMYDANVRGTERIFDAAVAEGIGRVVYVSTNAVFGNTNGKIVDESYERPERDYLSYYEETKTLAHDVALDRIAGGAPIVIAQLGGVYGPGDQSDAAMFIDQIRKGRMKFLMFPDTGFNYGYVEDIADGILLVHDKGKLGETYILGGEIGTVGDLIRTVARLDGKKVPRRELPKPLIRMSAPLGPVIGKLMGFPPNLSEVIKAADGVTYWATHAKAERELGYSPRSLETGMKETLAAD